MLQSKVSQIKASLICITVFRRTSPSPELKPIAPPSAPFPLCWTDLVTRNTCLKQQPCNQPSPAQELSSGLGETCLSVCKIANLGIQHGLSAKTSVELPPHLTNGCPPLLKLPAQIELYFFPPHWCIQWVCAPAGTNFPPAR